MPTDGRATRIDLLDFRSPQMRAFHMSWFAFFLCFFAWFGIAPLMAVVREEMRLTKEQIGWCIIGSVAITVLARLVDRLAVRPHRAAAGVHLAADARLAAGDGDRPGARLHDLPAVPRGDRGHRGVVRHHAVPHVADVRTELRRHGQRHDGRLGQPGRRRDADGHAAGVRGVRRHARLERAARLAAVDVRRRGGLLR